MTNTDSPDIPEIGIDIADFSVLRNEGYVYVDKTEFVREILDGPRRRLFLSRPRRFGKTLLIDTLEDAAAGRKELFSGLAIDRLRKDTEWPRSHVLRISMNSFGDDPS
ncbi:MAG: AAA family ATPase, partial [Deltaproteobacteria bacterium]|nr:AAA family ATPase [Deltaproteobacteria bacterium]